MAKLITTPVRVTIEHGDTRSTYSGGYASLSGDGTGLVSVVVNHARLINKETKPPLAVWSNSTNAFVTPTLRPTVSPEQTAMIAAAKAQERATLQAARIIEKAREQAEAVINDADHTLNMAIQSFIHTGKDTTDVARVLDGAGIYYNEVRGDNVATLNTEDLYLLDATELLTVG